MLLYCFGSALSIVGGDIYIVGFSSAVVVVASSSYTLYVHHGGHHWSKCHCGQKTTLSLRYDSLGLR